MLIQGFSFIRFSCLDKGCKGACLFSKNSNAKFSYKILKILIHARIEFFIDPLPPYEQAGFRRGKNTVDEVTTLLTQSIEDAFKAKKKPGAVFVNLTDIYDSPAP